MFGTYNVTLDNGNVHQVSCDNRDFIAFRRRGFRDLGLASPEPLTQAITATGGNDAAQGLAMLEFLAWLVWNAGTRAGMWSTDYDAFVEKECVSFALVDGAAADPTNVASLAPSVS